MNEQSDEEIDAALDKVLEQRTEETKQRSNRHVTDLEKAEAV